MRDGYHDDDEVQRRAYDGRLMRRLLAYVRPYRKMLIAAVLLLLLAALVGNVTPWLNMRAIDACINNPDRAAARSAGGEGGTSPASALWHELAEADKERLLGIVGLIAALMLIEAVVRYLQMTIVAYVGQKTMFEMRMGIFAHLQRMSLRFLDKNPVGRLMTRVTNDVEKIQSTIVTGMVEVVSDLFTIVVICGFMFWVNWRLAAIVLSTIPFVVLTSFIFRKYARISYLEIRKKVAKLNAYMQESVSGMRVIQIFGREDDVFEAFRARNAEHRDEWFRQVRNYAVYFPVIDFLGTLSLALIILYHGSTILGLQENAAREIQIGMFFAYVQWAERLFGPIRALADRYNLLLEAMASSERIFELLDTPEEIQNRPDAVVPERLAGRVEFRDVWFAYEQERWVLKGIDLDIAPGERVAIVGHTGAGKTSLINLLSRFYDVQQGAVRIDGVDVRDYDKDALRKRIGVVLQDVFLFSGTVEHNIRLGNEELTEEEITRCAAYVNALGFIERLPGGFQYDVGERGCNLSTGQRQLLAFARALAHDPQILVLDEATSSVDTASEALIQDAIIKLMQGRTSIVIAHRLSTVQHADRIIVMHHGEIRESGTHQELLARRGLYYRLYQLQYKDQISVA
ncbi:MAG: ABC transporter ATP-binding protein [Candidatus Hydrogenedentes bacterium]|nr:ABC transporter ATP-binding protein [Candidatus Hydrogenedentota bacterium]